MKWTTPCPSLKRPPIDTNTKKLEIRISNSILNSKNELNFIKKVYVAKIGNLIAFSDNCKQMVGNSSFFTQNCWIFIDTKFFSSKLNKRFPDGRRLFASTCWISMKWPWGRHIPFYEIFLFGLQNFPSKQNTSSR